MRYLCVVLAAVALLLVPACQATKKKASGQIRGDGFPAPDKEFVWNIAAQALRDQGYTPDSTSSSQQTWTIVSHWKSQLAPFSSHGFRERAVVTIHDVSCKPDYYYTETQVIRQVNDNMTQPGELLCAEWGDQSRMVETENLINRRIEMYFLPGCVSDDFQQQYGVQPEGVQRYVMPPCPERKKLPCSLDELVPCSR